MYSVTELFSWLERTAEHKVNGNTYNLCIILIMVMVILIMVMVILVIYVYNVAESSLTTF